MMTENSNEIIDTEHLRETIGNITDSENVTATSVDEYVKIRSHNPLELAENPPMSVHELMRQCLENFPTKIALRVKRGPFWNQWSFQDYWDEAVFAAKGRAFAIQELLLKDN